MSAVELELIDQAEKMVAELPARLAAPQSFEGKALMFRTGAELIHQLLDHRDSGLPIEPETIAAAFSAMDEALGRLIEIWPDEGERRRRRW